ncbi:MAG: galactose-1-phosphate uridylyltransferase [Candidatus Omnitrophica bacterium]|nr:galactose-1-phosphate uridylyltransferase [Candidatus Omnitrophota bacterium]
MSQLRKDPIVGRWTIVATERARRPAAFVDPQSTITDRKQCPYCQDTASKRIYESRGVKVINSPRPVLNESKPFESHAHGLYDVAHSYGSHEIVVETPEHVANMADLPQEKIKTVMQTYALRMQAHRKNPFIEYVLAYKNYGVAAGSQNIGHSRSQIMAVPVLPMRVKDKTSGAKKYFDCHERCLFCDIVSQELKYKERVVVENEHFVVITPFASRFPFETWILPKNHHCDFADGINGYENDLAAIMKDILLRLKRGLNDPAYNYMIQNSPVKNPLSFKDNYHWHIEVMPRLTRVAGFERGTGFYICPIPPEMTAAFLREVDIHA